MRWVFEWGYAAEGRKRAFDFAGCRVAPPLNLRCDCGKQQIPHRAFGPIRNDRGCLGFQAPKSFVSFAVFAGGAESGAVLLGCAFAVSLFFQQFSQ